MQKILTEAQRHAFHLLDENRDSLDRIAEALLEREVLGREELVELIGPKKVEEAEKIGST
jgi:ATP-dependent Zn protease